MHNLGKKVGISCGPCTPGLQPATMAPVNKVERANLVIKLAITLQYFLVYNSHLWLSPVLVETHEKRAQHHNRDSRRERSATGIDRDHGKLGNFHNPESWPWSLFGESGVKMRQTLFLGPFSRIYWNYVNFIKIGLGWKSRTGLVMSWMQLNNGTLMIQPTTLNSILIGLLVGFMTCLPIYEHVAKRQLINFVGFPVVKLVFYLPRLFARFQVICTLKKSGSISRSKVRESTMS